MKRLLSAFVVAVAAACGDQTATQYVGTVMNDASPEVSAEFSLTLFSRTDTSYSGILELGPPATGTGSAYAWHEGSELRIVSVAATGSDTIVWTSKLTDDGLGGRFEVTGGEHLGQGGTWRALLTKGPPATPETLRLPQVFPLAPASAMWPLVVLALVFASLAWWIRKTPEPIARDSAGAAFAPISGALKSGVSGWLALFVFGQVVGIVTIFVRLGALRTEYEDGIRGGAAITGLQPLIVVETAVQLLAPLVALAGVIMIVRRSRYAPRYWFAYLIFSGLFTSLDLALTSHVESELRRLLGAAYDGSTVKSSAVNRVMIRQVIFSLIWSLYWVRSTRVRATFGAAALDRIAATPVVAPTLGELAPASPAPTRRWWRVGLRTGGVIAAVPLVLAGVGLWEAHVRPYSVPAGTDIRKTVAGQWVWTTDKEGCSNAHIIAFSDGGKVMTIEQPSRDIAASDHQTTTYDIALVTQSSIRGAIRGETRVADDGKPVVWDLVLVGPDEYRWRRTDWFSPWGYTPRIVRCPANKMTEGPNR